ncbi:MAG: hypothetical protein CMJ05_02200 [Pelagibacterales bacterium]|nr:hypothetical protein [Pelagibacterales bacterium]
MNSLFRYTINIIEAFFLCLWIIICRLIGIDLASSLGSKIVKIIGPLSKFDKRAEINIKKIFPTLNAIEQKKY